MRDLPKVGDTVTFRIVKDEPCKDCKHQKREHDEYGCTGSKSYDLYANPVGWCECNGYVPKEKQKS